MADLPNRTADADHWNYSQDVTGKVGGHGLSSSYMNIGTSSGRAIADFFESEATSGEVRGYDVRLKMSAAGAEGEALRAFGVVNDVSVATGGTFNGAHLSMSITGSSGAIAGAGNAVRATLGIGSGVSAPGGTCAAVQVDSDFASGVSVPATYSFIRATNSNAVAMANFLNIPNAANGTMFAAHTTDAMTHSIKCVTAGGTAFYIMCTTTDSNRS